MSLKGKCMDIEEYPEMWSKEIIAAVENLKKGKRNSEKKLYKFVKDKTINKYTYKELIERHKDAKKEKELYISGYPIKEWLPVLQVILIIVSLAVIGNSIIIKNPFGVWLSVFVLGICNWNGYIAKYDYKKDLYLKVAWIVEKGSGTFPPAHLRDFKLVQYIEFEQREQNTPEQVRVDFSNETEMKYLAQILNDHKKHVIKQYFYNCLKTSEDFYKLNNLQYYFFSLKCFLSNNFCMDNVYDGYGENVSEHEYKRKLSEYGRVYYKLLLIVRLYVEADEPVRKLHNYINEEETFRIMKIIENNEEHFYK